MKQRVLSIGALMVLPVLCGAEHHTEEFGIASWYGGANQGRTTASGELFDEHRLTAAHRTLPMGTVVMVKNLYNGRSVMVRITDRGPAIRSRIIDVSKAAAERLAFRRRGLTRVEISDIRQGGSSEAACEREVKTTSSVEERASLGPQRADERRIDIVADLFTFGFPQDPRSFWSAVEAMCHLAS